MPAIRDPKAKSDKTDKIEGAEKPENVWHKKQKNKKEIDGGA